MLKVPRSTYYAAKNRPLSNRKLENDEYCRLIMEIWEKSKQRYGYPKIAAVLRNEGYCISNQRVWRLMCTMGIKSVVRKKYRYTGSKSDKTARENILEQNFLSAHPNKKWVTDITYIYTKTDGWAYLASVMDLFSRKIIGWVIGRKITAELAVTALDIALDNRNYPENVVVHSDMGSQYTSTIFTTRIVQCKLRQSFSKRGCPYDNACIESFHNTLKSEETNRHQYQTYEEVKNAVAAYISWYNTERIHGSIGNISPDEYESMYESQECSEQTANLDRLP